MSLKYSAYIIDTGIIKDGKTHIFDNAVAGDAYAFDDRIGHGTFVASIYAQNADARLVIYNHSPKGVHDPELVFSTLADIEKRVRSAPNEFHLINTSFHDKQTPDSSLGKRIAEYGRRLVEELGAMWITSASNDSSGGKEVTEIIVPAGFSWATVVSALNDAETKLADYSNFGRTVDFCAPGRQYVRTLNGWGYAYGTSFAAPYVGAQAIKVAQYLAEIGVQSPKDEDVYSAMLSFAVDMGDKGFDPSYGYGKIDLSKLPLLPRPQNQTKENNPVKKIYLSASTQEKNPCAQISGVDCKTEEQHCNQVMDAVADRLKANGFTVKRNRPEMDYASSYKEGNAFGADMYLCFHTNGSNDPTKRGAYWAYVTQDGKNKDLAALLSKHTTMDGVTVKAYDKTGSSGFGELDFCTAKHAAYAELGYHSSPDDHAWLHRNIDAIVEGITKAVCEYAGASYKPVDTAPVEPEPKPTLPALYAYTGDTGVNVRYGPGVKYDPLCKLTTGQKCIVLSLENGWAEVILHELNQMVRGWCVETYLRRV